MFCIHCGKQLPDGVRFCTNCGAPVKTKPKAPTEPAFTPPPPPPSEPSAPSTSVPPSAATEPSATPFTPPEPPQTSLEPEIQPPLDDESTEVLRKTTIPTFDSDMDPEATMLFIPGSLSHEKSSQTAPPPASSEPAWSSTPTPPPSEPMWSSNPTPPSSEPAWNSNPTPPSFYPPQRDVPPPEAMGYDNPMQPPRKKRSALPVVLAVLLILAALAAAAVFYFTKIAPASEKDAEPSQSLAVSDEEPSDSTEPSSEPSAEPSETPTVSSSFRAETLTGSYYSASDANDYLNLRMDGDQLSILLQMRNQDLLNVSIPAPDAPVFEVSDGGSQPWTFYCSPSEGLVTLVHSGTTYQFSQTVSAVPSPTVSAPLNGDYLFPTDSQYITNADLDNFTQQEIVLLRNEIYARHGCNFQDETIRNYFLSKSWYHPVEGLNASTFSSSLFNDYESANVDTILAYERAKGWRT